MTAEDWIVALEAFRASPPRREDKGRDDWRPLLGTVREMEQRLASVRPPEPFNGHARDGARRFAPGRRLLDKAKEPEIMSGLRFGGLRRNRLFVAATSSPYAVSLCVNGARRP